MPGLFSSAPSPPHPDVLPTCPTPRKRPKCPNRPTRAELLGNLAAARAQNPKFYPELLISDLERQLGARQRVK